MSWTNCLLMMIFAMLCAIGFYLMSISFDLSYIRSKIMYSDLSQDVHDIKLKLGAGY